jgi:diamine N-acetyltransferase
VIIGVKVYLRPIVKEDVKILNEWKNDEETFKYLGGGFMPLSIDQHAKWLESMMDTMGNNKRFIICDKQDVPIGMVGLYDINWIHRTCEIGVYLGNREAKGKGYGKEACQLIEHFASDYLNIRKIKLSVVSDNEIAVHMWESLGYQRVGEYKKERYIKGKYRNLTLMEKFTKIY